MSAAQQVLDQVHSLARVTDLEAEPHAYADRLRGELGSPGGTETLAGLEALDERLRHGLVQVDPMIERTMRIRLDHALAAETSIPAPTRRVFSSTVVGYAANLALLEQRARDVAARGGAVDPGRVAGHVVDAARASLALRDAVRSGVLALVRELAEASVPIADRNARDRTRDEPTRRRWSAVRRDLEATLAQPDQVLAAAMGHRLAALPDQLDAPAAEPETTFADFIEID